MKKLVLILGGLTLVLGAVLFWRLGLQSDEQDAPPGGSGVVEGTRVQVASRLGARIQALHARQGDTVVEGALMAELDCVEPDAAVAEAEARVAAARAQVDAARALAEALGFQQEAAEGQARSQRAVAGSVEVQQRNAARQSNRAVRLEADDAVTQVARETAETASEDLAQRVTAGKAAADAASRTARAAAMQAHASREQTRAAERQVEAGEAALERVKAIQAECRITAPAPGMVTIRAREPGEVLLPGSILFEITRSDDTRVTFFIPNRSLGSAAPGIQVRVSADAWPDRRFTGTIVAVSPEAEFTPRTVQTRSDRDRLVYAVEATLENGEGLLRPGMPVDVEIVPASPDDPAP